MNRYNSKNLCSTSQSRLLQQSNTGPQRPSQLDATQLLLHNQFSLFSQFVACGRKLSTFVPGSLNAKLTETEKSVHEGQVHTVLWPVLQFRHGRLILAPAFTPCLGAGANLFRHPMKRGQAKGLGTGYADRSCHLIVIIGGGCLAGMSECRQQRLNAIREVGEGKKLSGGEGIEDRWLVDAVERTWLDFAHAKRKEGLKPRTATINSDYSRILRHDHFDNTVASLVSAFGSNHGDVDLLPSGRIQ